MGKLSKRMLVSLLVFSCMISILSGCTDRDNNPDTQDFRLIADSMSAIYMPESLELFERSKESTENVIYTPEVADKLYRYYGDSLTDLDKSRNIVVDISNAVKSSNEDKQSNDETLDKALKSQGDSNKGKQINKYKVNVIISDEHNKPIVIQYIMKANKEGLIDSIEQRQLEHLPIVSEETYQAIEKLNLNIDNIRSIKDTPLKSDGSFGYTTGCIERSSVDKQILQFTAEASKEIEVAPPIYFIYGSMLIEAGIINSNTLYSNSLSDIYQDVMIGKGGESQYEREDTYRGNITRDKTIMIGPFQISSAYYDTWTKLASDELIKKAGGTPPSIIYNRGDTGQPLYLPDVILGKLNQCGNKIKEANGYMSEHYLDWESQPDIVKQFFGVMWYNIGYHGGANGISHAKENSVIIDYLYDICKEVYKDNNFLDDITDWSQSSSFDNECVIQICRKVDPNGDKGYLAGYKKYANEGNDTFLGDWSYAPKCLHFGLKKLEVLLNEYK